jgi:hypothetical protein
VTLASAPSAAHDTLGAFFGASGPDFDSISQTFATTPGAFYDLSFFYQVVEPGSPPNNGFRVLFNNIVIFENFNAISGFGTVHLQQSPGDRQRDDPGVPRPQCTELRLSGRRVRDGQPDTYTNGDSAASSNAAAPSLSEAATRPTISTKPIWFLSYQSQCTE